MSRPSLGNDSYQLMGKASSVPLKNHGVIVQDVLTESNMGVQVHEAKQCRICLQNEQESGNLVYKVCTCEGSVRYVHLDCMRRWIFKYMQNKSKQEQEQIKKNGIECELCRSFVKFTFQEGLILASCEEIPLLIEKQTILFVLVLCLIALVLGVVVYCICEMAAMAPDYMSLRFIIVSGILSVFGVLFGAVLIFFSSEFFFIHQKVISDIQRKKDM